MAMLDIIVILKDNISSFERLLISVGRQTADGMAVTAVTEKAEKLGVLAEKYDFRLVDAKDDLMSGLDNAVRSSEQPYAMIVAEDQMFEINFYEKLCPYFGKYDVIALNVSRLHRSGNFYKIFPDEETSVKACLMKRPCIYGCVFSTEVLCKNDVVLRSFSLSDQLDFINGCLDKSENSCYIPVSGTYIDDMTLSSTTSFVAALSKGEYKKALIRQSAKDCFEMVAKTRLYKFSGRVKRYLKRVLRRLVK